MPKSSNTSRLIVIEGLDGSGKATQAGLLAESLTAAGTPVRRISFPDYAHKSSIPVQMYLNGEIGSLEVGKQADIVVLDRDIRAVPAEQLEQTDVTVTIKSGSVLHSRQ